MDTEKVQLQEDVATLKNTVTALTQRVEALEKAAAPVPVPAPAPAPAPVKPKWEWTKKPKQLKEQPKK